MRDHTAHVPKIALNAALDRAVSFGPVSPEASRGSASQSLSFAVVGVPNVSRTVFLLRLLAVMNLQKMGLFRTVGEEQFLRCRNRRCGALRDQEAWSKPASASSSAKMHGVALQPLPVLRPVRPTLCMRNALAAKPTR